MKLIWLASKITAETKKISVKEKGRKERRVLIYCLKNREGERNCYISEVDNFYAVKNAMFSPVIWQIKLILTLRYNDILEAHLWFYVELFP